MLVMKKEKIERKKERRGEKKRKKKTEGCLQAFDQTGLDQTGRQAEGGRHQPTSSGRFCQTDMARCRRSIH